MRISALAVTVIVFAILVLPASAKGNIPYRWKNCTHVNQKYRHGVGKLHARDKTSDVPVTNFFHSTPLYNRAMSYNRGLDRDKDGIACEKA